MRPLSCWASGSLRPGCRPPRGQPCVLQPAASLSASVYSQVGQGDTQPRWSGGLDLASARAGRGWAGGARLGEGRKHRVVAGCTPAPSTASRTLGFSPGDPGVRPLQCSASPRAHLLGGEGRGGPGPRGEPRGWTGFVDASVTKSRTSPCGHGNPAAPALLGPTCPETGASGRDVGGPLGREACAVRPPGWSRSCSGRCRGCGRGRRSRSPCSCCRVRLCAPACPGCAGCLWGPPVTPREPPCACLPVSMWVSGCRKGVASSGPQQEGSPHPPPEHGRLSGRQRTVREAGLGGPAPPSQAAPGRGRTTSTPMDVSVPDMA